jgi:uncharacterized membrane protein
MNGFMAWWYRTSLPQGSPPEASPKERERARYARLTSMFILVLLIFGILLTPLSVFNSFNPIAPYIALATFGATLSAWFFSKIGNNWVAATLIVIGPVVSVVGNMLTMPLDPSIVPLFSALIIPLILAGALLRPAAVLIAGTINSAMILLIAFYQPHTDAYTAMMKQGLYSVTIILPILIQIVVALVIFAIMRSLTGTIRRADRAEDIIALQQEIAANEHVQAQEHQLLEDGIAMIAQVHAEIANGNFAARAPIGAEHVLWKVAVPLNNLLNRIQPWKRNSDQYERLQLALGHVARELQRARVQQTPVPLPQSTGTALDPLLPEINHLSEKAYSKTTYRL